MFFAGGYGEIVVGLLNYLYILCYLLGVYPAETRCS